MKYLVSCSVIIDADDPLEAETAAKFALQRCVKASRRLESVAVGYAVAVGTRQNPGHLIALGNPPAGRVMSEDVLGIFYRHVEDGELYAHAFGQDVTALTGEVGQVAFQARSRRPRSGIRMVALGDKRLELFAKDGHNISEDF